MLLIESLIDSFRLEEKQRSNGGNSPFDSLPLIIVTSFLELACCMVMTTAPCDPLLVEERNEGLEHSKPIRVPRFPFYYSLVVERGHSLYVDPIYEHRLVGHHDVLLKTFKV